jgi:hypothetical protein
LILLNPALMIRSPALSDWAKLGGIKFDPSDDTKVPLFCLDSYTEVLVIIPFLISMSSSLLGHYTAVSVVKHVIGCFASNT